jgi:hypothetical protein
MWLLLVGRKIATVKAKKGKEQDILKLFDAAPAMEMKELRAMAISGGYAESDNYGQHEEGYVVVLEDDGPDKDNIDDYSCLGYKSLMTSLPMAIVGLEDAQLNNVRPWHFGLRDSDDSANAEEDDEDFY